MLTAGGNRIKGYILGSYRNEMFLNSFYLMLATGVLAGFGFFFWLINARLFSVADIGLATTLISVMSLIAYLSLAGFDAAFVRFLPSAQDRRRMLNTGIIVVVSMATLLSIVFVIFVGHISPRLEFIRSYPLFGLIFIAACIMNAISLLADSVFLAHRRTKYSLVNNIILSVSKVALPFLFVGFGPMGIFTAAAVAQAVGAAVSVSLLITRFQYSFEYVLHVHTLQAVWRYCAANYAAGVLNLLPVTLLPIIITNELGPERTAYFYIVTMIGNLLYTIPWSSTKTLFAEGSNNERAVSLHVLRSVQTVLLLGVPAMLFLLVFGRLILGIFGSQYANGGLVFLYYVVCAGVTVSINSVFGSMFKIWRNLKSILATNVLSVVCVFILTYKLIPFGLAGIGAALFLSSAAVSIVSAVLYLIIRPKHTHSFSESTLSVS